MKVQYVYGKNICFRDVCEEDAAFILELRGDDQLGKFLYKTEIDLDKQKLWIRNYKQRTQEYYFIIAGKNGESYGTIRLYDVQGDSFCWGSWIIKKTAPGSIAVESAFLIYEFAFGKLGFKRSHFDVRKGNIKVVDFHKRLGSRIISEDDLNYYFNLSLADYALAKQRYTKYIPEQVEVKEAV